MLKVKSGVRPTTGSPAYWVIDTAKPRPLGNGEVLFNPIADKYGCLYFNSAKEAKEAIKRGDF